ncbi:ABC-type Fe3+-hydroxamate transport system, periplasmic component [uncultured Sporomusa sp.]|uniref:ABC-type Fe3+-hydroxamate transport system, periplasmic component n=1 Tax=uncultured Sporomusa sp. TaxID=307249 RepID=A0A212LZ37_9FIRM|nr:ABC transporter substrate-binding protein [uncultured Sporomusa sp.]SCM82717.1 ABC-type Fe3+-hydroxamate transport system, periplasmic component [uncultured Sporomusa sp.]
MKAKLLSAVAIVLLAVALAGCGSAKPAAGSVDGNIKITDDFNQTIVLKTPAKRIISLYSAHTENLLALGLDAEIIGVSPAESAQAAKDKPVFDYRADPEKVLAAQPDVVIIRPFIKQSHPDFVKTLEQANIKVVCLYPERFEEFDSYIKKLAVLTGREQQAGEQLAAFHARLNAVAEHTAKAQVKKRVYFEATTTEYRTITPDSMPGRVLQLAGGVNMAADAQPLKTSGSIAAYGSERLLMKAEEIDVFLAQRGPMNPGVTPEAIKQRPGFDKIKAVREGQVYIVDEKLVSTPSFRLADGVEQLARLLYPEVFSGQ